MSMFFQIDKYAATEIKVIYIWLCQVSFSYSVLFNQQNIYRSAGLKKSKSAVSSTLNLCVDIPDNITSTLLKFQHL